MMPSSFGRGRTARRGRRSAGSSGCARDGTSTMAVRDQRDRVAAERAEAAGEAVETVRGRSRGGMKLIKLLNPCSVWAYGAVRAALQFGAN